MQKCEYCSATFATSPGKRYCRRRCKELAHQQRRLVFRVCEHCGEDFSAQRRANGHQRFCSVACWSAWGRNRKELARIVKFHRETTVLRRRYVDAMRRDPCSYCGRMCQGRGAMKAMHLDHVTPRRRGGAGAWTRSLGPEWENLTAACFECNYAKGRQSLLEFLAWPTGWLTA